jgi:hypothetical protein
MSKKPEQLDWSDIKRMSFPDVKIDATDPNNLSNRVADERETRKKLLSHARLVGCEKDMLLLFAKYDKLMRNCTNEKERRDMSQLACVDVYRLLGGGGELYVNGQLVCKDD